MKKTDNNFLEWLAEQIGVSIKKKEQKQNS